jgi:hypothetical protein
MTIITYSDCIERNKGLGRLLIVALIHVSLRPSGPSIGELGLLVDRVGREYETPHIREFRV